MAYPPGAMRYVCVGAAISRPVVSPWETTSARCADNAIPNICKRNSAVQCRNMVFLQYCYIIRPIWFCSKICNVGGRMISAPTTHRNIRSVIRWHRLRRASLPSWAARFHCYFLFYIEGKHPTKSCCGLRRIFAGGSGADITKNLFPKKEVLVGEDGFEPSKRNAADLQSVPFGHSGTPPYSIRSDFGTDWSR